jgi:nucleoside-diphosphate-sugar epimerase
VSAPNGTVLVLGPQGVTGSAITTHLATHPGIRLVTASRRHSLATIDSSDQPTRHIRVDLLDAEGTRAAFAPLGQVTHLVHAAYLERPTMAETAGPNVAMLAHALDALNAAGADLQRVVLIGGGKSYGEHLGAYKTPAKESDPRFLGPIFYNDQEDLLAARATASGFTWTVLRPDVVIGPSAGSPMNLLTTIGVYAALSKADGVPLRFPGSAAAWTALHQITDADLLAQATSWALTSPAAADQVFNVTNGDLFRWQYIWDDIAAAFDMPTAPPQPMNLAEQMADKEPAWDLLRAHHGLQPVPYAQLGSWAFADAVWNSGFDMVQSTTKIRLAGFGGTIDSHDSLTRHLKRLRTDGYVP